MVIISIFKFIHKKQGISPAFFLSYFKHQKFKGEKDMTINKIINPCKCKVYTTTGNKVSKNAFAKIKYDGKSLSISGVIAPLVDGNCLGSAGQCVDEIREGIPTDEWTPEMLKKFCDIWDKWHLNDMRPYCEHMKELGWIEHIQDKVKIEKWTLTKEAYQKKENAEKRALNCLRNGETFEPTMEETAYANMKYSIEVYDDEDIPYKNAYELNEKDCLGHTNTKYITRRWISYKDNELGFIGRSCPVCGYKYGTSWKIEEVPQDVIEWLNNLPETKVTPAWV